MRITPFHSGTTIVLVGNFNPLIFKPGWFAHNNVIGETEAENAEIEVIHSELVKFHLNWLTIVVEKSRFIAEVKQPPVIRLHDFVMKTFGELLIHTPVWSMGINQQVEFDAGSVDLRNKIGYTLAPIDAWGEWSKDLEKTSDTDVSGMVSLTMKQSIVDDRVKGYIQTKVEPSKKVASGVLVEVNDHYSVESLENVEGCMEIMGMLNNNFEKSTEKSTWIADQVMSIIK